MTPPSTEIEFSPRFDFALSDRNTLTLRYFFERETGRVDLDSVKPSWLIFSDGFSSGQRLSGVAKRLVDIGVSLTMVILAAPIIAITAVAIKLESPGPAFFRQRRVGLFGEPFDI